MSTKKCPFCAEAIQEEAVRCKHCGEMLDQQITASTSPSPVGEEAAPSEVKPKKKTNWFLVGLFIGLLFWALVFRASPVLGLLVALLAVGLGVLLFKKIEPKGRGIVVALCGVSMLLVGGLVMNIAHQESVAQQQAAEQKQLAAEQRMEELRQAMPENYAQGMKLLEEEDYEGALAAFSSVAAIDPNHENLPDLVKEANEAFDVQKAVEQEALKAQKAAERLVEAKALVAEADRLSWSKNCSEMATAERNLLQARQLDSNQKNESLLKNIRLSRLSCYQGNHEIQMAVRIEYDSLTTLYVWIKNVSRTFRHANPNNFTLVTRDGQSLSIATSTYSHSSYFDAVDLQPNAKTEGYLVFDTRSEPKTLIYKELSGTQISREFP